MTVDEVIHFYETFSPQSVSRFPEFYSGDAFFKDPFNEVCGPAAIQHIFSHMFTQVAEPRFIVKEKVGGDRDAVLVWEFHFAIRFWRVNTAQVIHGVSHLKFDNAGCINYHRDYWDANEELFVKLPGIGLLMRRLRKVFAAPSTPASKVQPE